jgi:hypothetical protein
MSRLSFNVVKSLHEGKGKKHTVLYLCFAMLFVYSALLTSANHTGWMHDGADHKSGYLIGKRLAGDISGMRNADTDGTSRTFTDLVQTARSAGNKILSSAVFHSSESGFLSVKNDTTFFGGELVSLIQNWGYNSINAPMQSRYDGMTQDLRNGSSFLGRQFPFLISDLKTVTIAIAPKPLLNSVAIWDTLIIHLGAERVSTAQKYASPAIAEL